MPNWDAIRKEYEAGGVTLKELAEKHGVKDTTLRSRKNREKWDETQRAKNATQRKNVATQKQAETIIENDELNDKQKMFCLYYIKYFNATKAYQKAYNCNYKTANSEGYKHLVKPGIKMEVERLKKERAEGVLLDAESVLQKYIDIAFADITDFTSFGRREVAVSDEQGNVEMVEVNYVDFKESAEIDGTLITEVKKGKDGVSIKLADKMKALDFLSEYTDLLSNNQKKRLQEEKARMDIAKLKAEIDNMNDDSGDKPIEIVIKRKGDSS